MRKVKLGNTQDLLNSKLTPEEQAAIDADAKMHIKELSLEIINRVLPTSPLLALPALRTFIVQDMKLATFCKKNGLQREATIRALSGKHDIRLITFIRIVNAAGLKLVLRKKRTFADKLIIGMKEVVKYQKAKHGKV